MVEEIEEAIFPALSLIFLLLGMVLLIQILFSAFNPYDQIAFANAERLKAAIDEACLTGSPVTLKNFELRQNTPLGTGLFVILPRWLIRSNGDPNYALYYESFPAGEGIGWEVYHDFQNRLITPLPDGHDGDAGDNVVNHVNNVFNTYRSERPNEIVDAIVISNIVLSDSFRADYLLKGEATDTTTGYAKGGPINLESTTEREKFFGYGKWVGDLFRFSNYLGLTNLEKTLIKYQACGPKSLCLKTRNGVYRFLLDHCDDIKSVQLVYDAKGDVNLNKEVKELTGAGSLAGGGVSILKSISGLPTKFLQRIGIRVGGGLITAAGLLLGDVIYTNIERHVAFKTSDFYAVSPCALKEYTIEKASCSETFVDKFYYTLSEGPPDNTVPYQPCWNVIRYPIYEYDPGSGKLEIARNEKTGEQQYHYECVEQINGDADKGGIDSLPTGGGYSFYPGDQCIQVKVPKIRDEYCWTPNPYKESHSFWQLIFNTDTRQEIANYFTGLPVRESTAFLADPAAVVMKPTSVVAQKGDELSELFGRITWWP